MTRMAKTSAVVFPLLQYTDDLVDELRGHVPKAFRDFEHKSIHQARVATRRLKAALDLMRFVLSDEHRKPFARVLRKLRRRLGPLRDLDVMIGHLGELKKTAAHARAVQWMEEQLKRQREVARKKSVDGAPPGRQLARLGSWWGLREEISEAREAIDTLLAESLHLQIDAFAERADRLTQNAGPDTTGTDPHAEPDATDVERQDPHQLRIAGKLLRYTLEMAAVQEHKLPPRLTRSFKKMQEELGLWHDYVVLSERAMQVSLEMLLPHHDAALQAEVLDLAKVLLRRSSRHLDNFGRVWRERGPELTECVRERFPLTRTLSAPQTDPGQDDSEVPPAPVALPSKVVQGA